MTDDRSRLAKALAALDAARKKLKKFSYLQEDIAIIGQACRFPGGANSPEEFWQLLTQGFDSSIEVPKTRWDIDAYYDPNPDAAGKIITRKGSFINVPIDEFDAEFFNISPREAEYLDPQQRLLLETSWEALCDAGIDPHDLRDSNTGVFIGMSSNDYRSLLEKYLDANSIEAYFGTGNAASTATGRISYTLGLRGPSLAIDTACSSALVALHEACASLRMGESDLI
ncbi:MAG: beta-ketoacyl synthase N-terminal-like domain-containing protein, partial [Gammaproteobacteria bacterium]